MCQLAKENPEVKEMIEANYADAYPQARVTCGDPMTFSVDGRGQIKYDGKTATISRPGATRETIIQFDSNGNESGVKYPKSIRGGGWEQLAWNETPSNASSADFDRFAYDYRTRVLPMVAEAGACCSGEGVTPTAAECSRYGIQSAQSSAGSPSKANSKATKK